MSRILYLGPNSEARGFDSHGAHHNKSKDLKAEQKNLIHREIDFRRIGGVAGNDPVPSTAGCDRRAIGARTWIIWRVGHGYGGLGEGSVPIQPIEILSFPPPSSYIG
jgi:hypothetical protein